MNKPYLFSIWWIKRDLRLSDNQALHTALEQSQYVLPLFAFEPSIITAPDYSRFHRYAVATALKELGQTTRKIGGEIWVDTGEIEEILSDINSLQKIDAVFSHEETGSGFTFARDKRLQGWLETKGIPWHEIPTNGVIRRLPNRDARTKIWHQRIHNTIIAAPSRLPLPTNLYSECTKRWERFVSSDQSEAMRKTAQVVSEGAGHRRLSAFLSHKGIGYSGGISSPNTAFKSGSRLSPHLAWGTLSLRQVVQATERRLSELRNENTEDARRWRRSLNAFSSRLHWHDHFIQRLESEPNMEYSCLNSAFESLPYKENIERLQRWLSGHTGVPFVDACMRCLNTTGFLNFRMRAMVVSYACHVLHLSWKDIMYPLAQLFLDYEPGIHISQLQMQAGVVGINTVRVYNPDKQMLEHDPKLTFIRQWIPELSTHSDHTIFNYLESPLSNYSAPLVNYKEASTEMKQALYSLKRSAAGKTEAKRVLDKHGSRKQPRRKIKKDSRQGSLFSDD